MKKILIKTKRFILRPLSLKDVNERYLNWFNDKEIKKNIKSAKNQKNIYNLKAYIKKRMNKKDIIFLAIIVKKNKIHIGNIKFEPVDMNNSIATMGILIGDYNWRGKGVASEVLISCSNWLYKNKNINKIILGVDKKNNSAINAYKKSNFKKCITYPKDNKIIRMIRYHNISKKIVIGTAQIGNRYGIANKSNKVNFKKAKYIIKKAYNNGINYLDTAGSYNNSEKYLGKIGTNKWKISTKLPAIPFECSNLKYWFDKTFFKSFKNLKCNSIDTLLLHNPNDLLDTRGKELYKIIQKLKDKNLISKFGISIYDFNNLNLIISKFDIDTIQFPFNLFDRRILSNNLIYKLKDLKIETYARSVFMQGLLLINKKDRPKEFKKWNNLWKKYDAWLKNSKLTPIEACLGYVNSFPEIDKIIIGVNRQKQLSQILKYNNPIIDVPSDIKTFDIKLINPANWN